MGRREKTREYVDQKILEGSNIGSVYIREKHLTNKVNGSRAESEKIRGIPPATRLGRFRRTYNEGAMELRVTMVESQEREQWRVLVKGLVDTNV